MRTLGASKGTQGELSRSFWGERDAQLRCRREAEEERAAVDVRIARGRRRSGGKAARANSLRPPVVERSDDALAALDESLRAFAWLLEERD